MVVVEEVVGLDGYGMEGVGVCMERVGDIGLESKGVVEVGDLGLCC